MTTAQKVVGTLMPFPLSLILWGVFGLPFPACGVVSVGYWVWWFFVANEDEDPHEGI